MGERECEKKVYVGRKGKWEGNLKMKGKWGERGYRKKRVYGKKRVHGNKEKIGNVRIWRGKECRKEGNGGTPISGYSKSFFGLFQVIPGYSRLFQIIPAYSRLNVCKKLPGG